jgi:K+-sensing histidine kinase KdpD
MSDILNTTHDLINKYSILYYQVDQAIQTKKDLKPEKIEPIVVRIGELINSVCLYAQDKEKNYPTIVMRLKDFTTLLQSQIDKLGKIFSSTHLYMDTDFPDENDCISINAELIFQILENCVENSVNAGKELVAFRITKSNHMIQIAIIDSMKTFSLKPKRLQSLPNGIGKKIIHENVKKMSGKVTFVAINDDQYCVTVSLPVIANNHPKQ